MTKLTLQPATNGTSLMCDDYHYVWPAESEWHNYPEIEVTTRRYNKRAKRINDRLLMDLRYMVECGRGEEAWIELQAAILRGDA